jgi:hypothetical protein
MARGDIVKIAEDSSRDRRSMPAEFAISATST